MRSRWSEAWSHPRVRALGRWGALACLLLAITWSAVAGFRWQRQVGRAIRATKVIQAIHLLQSDLEVRREVLYDPGGTSRPLATEDEVARRTQQVRHFFSDHPDAQRALDEAERHCAEAVRLTRAYLREAGARATPPGNAAPAEAALQPIARELSAGGRRLAVLAEHAGREVDQGLAAAHASNRLLLAGLAAVLLLLWRFYRTDQQRRRHMEGARLVEEMLEAYSRRLETMNVQLEQLNLLKTQFLANTSHELLTPLNGVMGSLDVIRSGSCGADEDRQFVEQAYQSAEKLHALIRDLLDLCRLEEGNFALRVRPVDFGPALERELARHRVALSARDVVLLVTAPSGGWPGVEADPERLRQILHHILANAAKFTERGSIRVTGRVVDEEGPRLRIEVADTGVGIAPERLGQVFELFSQGDNSSTRKFGGTGLGLTLTRHLVHGMGGRIGVESDGLGRGTRVWFTLRLSGQAEGTAAGADPGSSERVRSFAAGSRGRCETSHDDETRAA